MRTYTCLSHAELPPHKKANSPGKLEVCIFFWHQGNLPAYHRDTWSVYFSTDISAVPTPHRHFCCLSNAPNTVHSDSTVCAITWKSVTILYLDWWSLSRVWLVATPWTARLLCPGGFSRQEYWSGLSCPPAGDRPNPGIKPRSPALQADSFPAEPPGKSLVVTQWWLN